MNLDILIFQQINGLAGQCGLLDKSGVFFAEYLQYVLAAVLIWFFRKDIKTIIFSVSAAVVAKFGFAELIRLFWSRSRPFIDHNVNLLFEKVNEPSFPSGHASFFFALSTVIYFKNKKVGILFYAASFLISISRVFAGVHWPSDILAGAVVGVFSGWTVMKLAKRF